jgi:hypothetical protein
MMELPILPKIREAPPLVIRQGPHIDRDCGEIFSDVCDWYSKAGAKFYQDYVPPQDEGNGRIPVEAYLKLSVAGGFRSR